MALNETYVLLPAILIELQTKRTIYSTAVWSSWTLRLQQCATAMCIIELAALHIAVSLHAISALWSFAPSPYPCSPAAVGRAAPRPARCHVALCISVAFQHIVRYMNVPRLGLRRKHWRWCRDDRKVVSMKDVWCRCQTDTGRAHKEKLMLSHLRHL